MFGLNDSGARPVQTPPPLPSAVPRPGLSTAPTGSARALATCTTARPRAASARALLAGLLLMLGLLVLLVPPRAIAQPLQAIPELSARVMERSGTLAPQQVQALEERLATFERERGTQIVVLLIPTTAPEDIAAYAFRVADAWKIGRRDVGDGILVVVAKDDRRIRIEVARALEGAVPDVAAFRVIDGIMTPAFRRGDFAGGLEGGVEALMALVRGEALPLPDAPPQAAPETSLEDLGAFLFVAVPVVGAFLTGVLGRKLGALATGGAAGFVVKILTGSLLLAGLAGLLAAVFVLVLGIGGGGGFGGGPGGGLHRGGPIIWGGGGRGGLGRGGGGFRSGGGGSFGGGGASGSW